MKPWKRLMATGVWLLTLLCAVAQQDRLRQPVTIEAPAQSLKHLLQSLSAQAGVKLLASSAIESEIVLVSVRDMPLRDLMTHLAAVVDAEWVRQRDGSYRLTRSTRIAQARRREDNALLTQALKRALQQELQTTLVAPLTEDAVRTARDQVQQLLRDHDPASAKVEPNVSPSPGGVSITYSASLHDSLMEALEPLRVGERLLHRLLQQIDIEPLLEIPVGERYVFSNRRGRYLLPLEVNLQPLLEQYYRERQVVYRILNHPNEGIDRSLLRQVYESLKTEDGTRTRFDSYFLTKPSQHPPQGIYLQVRRDGIDSFSFELLVVAESAPGQPVEVEQAWLYLAGWSDSSEQDNRLQHALNLTSEQLIQLLQTSVEWSQRIEQFLEAHRVMRRARESTPLPEVLDPARTEPLSLIPTDVLLAYARFRNRSLVALLPDSLCSWLTLAIEEETSTGSTQKRPPGRLSVYLESATYGLRFDEEARVLRVRPRYSSYAWGRRVPRETLSSWLHQLLKRQYPRLQDYLTLHQLGSHFNPLTRLYAQLVLPAWEFQRMGQEGFALLRSLTPAQIQRLQQGEVITLAELTPAQRQNLYRDLYREAAFLTRAPSPQPATIDNSEEDWLIPREASVSLPHYYYPDGLPAETRIQKQKFFDWALLYLGRLSRSAADSDRVRELAHYGIFAHRQAGVWGGFVSLPRLASMLNNPHGVRGDITCLPVRFKPVSLEVEIAGRHLVRLPSGGIMFPLGDFEPLLEVKAYRLDELPDIIKEALQWLQRLVAAGSTASG